MERSVGRSVGAKCSAPENKVGIVVRFGRKSRYSRVIIYGPCRLRSPTASDTVDCRVHRGSDLEFSCNETRRRRCRREARAGARDKPELCGLEGELRFKAEIQQLIEKEMASQRPKQLCSGPSCVWALQVGERRCCSVYMFGSVDPQNGQSGHSLDAVSPATPRPYPVFSFGSSLLFGRGTWPVARTAVRSSYVNPGLGFYIQVLETTARYLSA